MIANNTLHKAFDLIKHELEINVPVFHIIELTKEYILNNNYKMFYFSVPSIQWKAISLRNLLFRLVLML